MIIDGGHTEFIATQDFDNFKKMTSKDNIVVFDDYPSRLPGFAKRLGAMWETKKRNGEIIEIFSCVDGSSRGFALGRMQF